VVTNLAMSEQPDAPLPSIPDEPELIEWVRWILYHFSRESEVISPAEKYLF
jgi:hypothetical protein